MVKHTQTIRWQFAVNRKKVLQNVLIWNKTDNTHFSDFTIV